MCSVGTMLVGRSGEGDQINRDRAKRVTCLMNITAPRESTPTVAKEVLGLGRRPRTLSIISTMMTTVMRVMIR